MATYDNIEIVIKTNIISMNLFLGWLCHHVEFMFTSVANKSQEENS